MTERLNNKVGHSFPSKEQVSFNFMAAVTVHSNFGAQENKICHYFHFFTCLNLILLVTKVVYMFLKTELFGLWNKLRAM